MLTIFFIHYYYNTVYIITLAIQLLVLQSDLITLLSAVLGRTKFWSQKPRIIEVWIMEVLLYFISVGRTTF